MLLELHGRKPVPDGRKVDLLLEDFEVEVEVEVELEVGAAAARVDATRTVATNLLRECKTIMTVMFGFIECKCLARNQEEKE